MLRGNREFWLALFVNIIITGIYSLVMYLTRAIPPAGEIFGKGMGILGFILMVMTEAFYSLRKRSTVARWGKMPSWLQFHIFTRLVGPYMMLLHTSWKFHGLAGATILLTIIILGSGFIRPYIYTRIPCTADGFEIKGILSEQSLRQARRLLALWHTIHIPIGKALFISEFARIGTALYYVTFSK